MIHLTGPGPGTTQGGTPGQPEPQRDVQAARRDSERAHGATPGAGSGTMTARPVTESAQGAMARPPDPRDIHTGAPARRDGRDTGDTARDPLLTGPRPTFDRTPLEKLRTDAVSGDSLRPPAKPPDAAAPADAAEPEPEPDDPSRSPQEKAQHPSDIPPVPDDRTAPGPAYDGMRDLTPDPGGSRLNLTR